MSVISVTTSFSPSSTSSLASSTCSASPPSATTAVSAAVATTAPLKSLHDISYMTMDFQSAMETFAEAWVAANAKTGHHLVSGGSAGLAGLGGLPGLSADNIQSHGMALTRPQQCRTPPAAHATTTHTAASLAATATVQMSSTNNQQQQLSVTTCTIPTTTIVNNNNINNNNNNNNNSNSSCHGRDSTSPPNRMAVSVAAHKARPDHGSSPRDLTGVGASSADSPPPNAMLSVKEEPGNDSMKQNGKSLPIHCIVESICMLDEGRLSSCISNTQTPTSHQIATSGSNPTSVNVNMGTGGTATTGTPSSSPWRRRSIIEVDSFVIIPASTSFHDLVQVALLRLGYGPESAAVAKATVVIKNWKPLNFEQISEDPLACVGDILGDLTSVVTLRMQVFRGRPGALVDIKDKLLRFLLVQSHGLLVSAGCPLDELILSQICRLPAGGGGSLADITDDCRRKFDHWWHAQLNPHSPSTASRTPAPATPHLSAPTTPVKANDLSQHSQQNRHLPDPPNRTPTNSAPISHLHAPVPIPVHNSVHPGLVQPMHGNPFPAAQQKTRMRTSFDPELELPKLQRWFADNQHPSRQQIQQYVKELNGLESRRGRKPLDVNNVVYWFKNARAAQKRAEIRGVGGVGLGTGMPHLSVNGYNGHSPTNGSGYLLNDGYLNSERMMLDHRLKGNYGRSGGSSGSVVRLNLSQGMDEYSNAGSDLDEEDMTEGNGTPSPVAPLSLTTSRKDDSRDPSPRPITPKSQAEQTNFPKEEPINYHSPDHSNNNKTVISDGDDGDDMEVVEDSTDAKNFSGAPMFRSSSVSSYTRSISPNDFLRQTAVAAAVAAAANNESECIERLAAAFPIGSNSMFGHSIMYMSQYIPSLGHHAHHPNATSPPNATSASMALSADERRKRNRTFIDPVTEVPRLEQWFSLNTHPSHNLILKYTEELNCMAYRQKFPRLEPKNVQFWFKNRRAKCKRLKMSLFESPSVGHYHHSEDKE